MADLVIENRSWAAALAQVNENQVFFLSRSFDRISQKVSLSLSQLELHRRGETNRRFDLNGHYRVLIETATRSKWAFKELLNLDQRLLLMLDDCL